MGQPGRSDRSPEKRNLRSFAQGATVRALAVLLLVVLAGLRVLDPFPVEALRVRTFDLFQIIKPRPAQDPAVVIVDIDERSLAEIGQWPWPRTVIGRLTDTLLRAGARVVAYDFLFAEPDRTSPAQIARWLEGLPPETTRVLRELPDNDAAFAATIAGKPVVLGQAVSEEKAGAAMPWPEHGRTIATIGGDPRRWLGSYAGLVRNRPELERAAAGAGIFSVGIESDNIVRRTPMLYRVEDRLHPAFVTEILRVLAGGDTLAVRSDAAGITGLIVGPHQIVTDDRGRVWIHFARPRADRFVSAGDVLNGRMAAERVRDKVVMIGTSAAALRDVKATPIAHAVAGVEIHAQLLENILSDSGLTRPNFALGVELAILLAIGGLIIALVPVLGARWTLLLGVVIALPLAAGAWYLYDARRMLIDVAYPAAGAAAIYLFLVFINYLRGEGEKRRIRDAFSRYLAPALVNRLAAHPESLKLGGEHKEMTLLFSDVQGFTGISEMYDAVALTTLINRMFNPLTRAILDHGGTVDKYMGDSIMAFWNAPLDDPDHARNACLAALEMGRRIPALNEELRIEAEAAGRRFIPINLGIGLNTGDCCVGNMGSDLRFNYSVLGDSVNIAARLEGQTRGYKVRSVVGESTARLVPDMAFLELDLVTVAGKTAAVRVYTLLGDRTIAESEIFRQLNARNDAMLRAYRAQDWSNATAALGACRALQAEFGLEGFYDLYEQRIAAFRLSPPERGWNGVYAAAKG